MKTKVCTQCNKEKVFKKFGKNPRCKFGVNSQCKECLKIKRRKYVKSNREVTTKAHREWCIKNTYGLTLGEFDQMFEAQGGVCRVCSKINLDGRRLYIDHDHKTGKVRGLLCHKCNSLLGFTDDNIDYLLKVIDYLK